MSLTIPKNLSESFNMTFLLYHGHVNYVTRYASNDNLKFVSSNTQPLLYKNICNNKKK